VRTGSIGEECGIEPGDKLRSINGEIIHDIIDYESLCSEESLNVEIEKKDGSLWLIDISKEAEESLGLIFERDLMDRQRQCANNCIFCFIDQLPPDMRSSLYYKDDDWRLSFIMGNYITLTNTSMKEVNRIINRRVNPLYISVHSTEKEIRERMLRNPRAGSIMEILKRFYDEKLYFHNQIVLCPGINDGMHLDKTLQDLWGFYPYARSVAVVPVGLTSYREGLYPIKPFTACQARQVIEQVERWQKECLRQQGTAFVFAADEFYTLAGIEIPPYEAYEGFPQIENGVGLIAKFKQEFYEALDECSLSLHENRHVSIVTGVSAAPYIREMAGALEKKFNKLRVEVYPIINQYFGPTVTVAGLVTGSDILAQLAGKELGDIVLLPRVMLRERDTVFLDNISLEDLEKRLGVKVCPVWVDGRDFVYAVVSMEKKEVK